MLKFLMIFATRVVARFMWMGLSFGVLLIFGRGPIGRQIRLGLMMMRRLIRF